MIHSKSEADNVASRLFLGKIILATQFVESIGSRFQMMSPKMANQTSRLLVLRVAVDITWFRNYAADLIFKTPFCLELWDQKASLIAINCMQSLINNTRTNKGQFLDSSDHLQDIQSNQIGLLAQNLSFWIFYWMWMIKWLDSSKLQFSSECL